MYRRTAKYSAARQEAMQRGRSQSRMDQPAPDYPAELPDVRMRITVERCTNVQQSKKIARLANECKSPRASDQSAKGCFTKWLYPLKHVVRAIASYQLNNSEYAAATRTVGAVSATSAELSSKQNASGKTQSSAEPKIK